ncbi:TRAP transporter small permease [Virgibacillus sp. Bac330]|uniref:TRAP transporter small permease n=1 Tax=Virgibacillus sp. Bac330 TaxID=2419841 RepID=UPI000EF4D29C|nr:TRAP transporter small permease [Virgibacillus sp. Bac330]
MKRWIEQLARFSHRLAQCILFMMAIYITIDVLSRWMWNKPILGAVDFTELGLSMVIFLSIAYTHVKEEHISIDFVFERFPKRMQLVLHAIIHFLTFILMVLIGWSTSKYAIRLYNANTTTGDLTIPLYPIAWVAVIGLSLFALSALLHAIRYMHKGVFINDS